MSQDYEEAFSSLGGRLINLLEIRHLIDILGHPSEQLILDVGTGTGRIARHLLDRNNEVVGIDVSSERLKLALKKARREFKGNANAYYLIAADGHSLPFKNKIFNVVLSVRTLKYFKNPNMAFSEMARILKHSGICVLELSNIYGYEALWLLLLKLFDVKNYGQNMGTNYRLFNLFKIKKTLKELNLVPVSEKAWHKIPTIIFIKCEHFTLLKILFYIEIVLQKFLPTFLFSRGILIKCMRFSES